MEYFTDAQGRFVFPSWLFPELAPAANLPPSVADRREAIEREYSVLKSAGIARNYKWAVDVLQFQEVWGDLQHSDNGAALLAQAQRIIEKLASGSTQYAGAANYLLGKADARDSASRVHYRTALKKGYERAWYRVGAKADSRGDKDSAISRFKRGAERGDAACQYTMGLAYIKGLYGLRRNPQEGVHLIEEAVHGSDADFPRAPYVLGKILLGEGGDVPNGLGLAVDHVSVDRERGIELVQKSALLGFAPALLRIGQARQSKEFGFDCAVALRYVGLAAEQDAYRRFRSLPTQLRGDPEVSIVKWLLCGYKDIVRINEQWAFRFAEIGASEHNGTALFALGYFYEVGVSTDTNVVKAIEYYREGAREGCAAASARLDQMATNKPNLRRTLTRQDHDAKMRKHRTALISGEGGDVGLAAIRDQSTLNQFAPGQPTLNQSEQTYSQRIPSPIPEPPTQEPREVPLYEPAVPQPPASQSRVPYPESPTQSPQVSVSDLNLPHRGSSLSSMSSGPSLHSAVSTPASLPYPVEDHTNKPPQQFSQQPLQARSISSFYSASDRPALPYPDAFDPNVPLQFAPSLPYPTSPEPQRPSSKEDERLAEALQSASIESGVERNARPMPSYRSFSSGPTTTATQGPTSTLFKSPLPQQQQPQQQPEQRQQLTSGGRRGHGATMSMSALPSQEKAITPSDQLRSVPELGSREANPSTSSRHSSRTPSRAPKRVPVGTYGPITNDRASIDQRSEPSSGTSTPKSGTATPRSISQAASLGAPLDLSSTPQSSTTQDTRSGIHTIPKPAAISVPARASLHHPETAPKLPPSGSDSSISRASPQQFARIQSANVSTSTSMQSLDGFSTPLGSPTSRSRQGSMSPSSSLASSPEHSPTGSPGSLGSPGRRRRKARPLSSSWVRESISGANRFFSTSQTSLDRADGGYVDANLTSNPASPQRSHSPLKKMFKSSSERSVTDSAVLHKPRGPDPSLANVPKVPVQPIVEKREPGVAYTFEDMGVTAVTNAKNDKCIIA